MLCWRRGQLEYEEYDRAKHERTGAQVALCTGRPHGPLFSFRRRGASESGRSTAALRLMKSRKPAIAVGIAVTYLLMGCSAPSHSSKAEQAAHSAKGNNGLMTEHHLTLSLQKEILAICRLPPDASVPAWARSPGAFHTISRTPEELSIVCLDSAVPSVVKKEPGWRLLKVDGPLDFSLTGILASVAGPLAKARISIFAISSRTRDVLSY